MREQEKRLDRDQERQLWPYAHNRTSFRSAHICSILSARRFSVQLDSHGRGSQTWLQFAYPALHLLQGGYPALAFPRTHYHLVVGNSHRPGPMLRSAHAWFLAQQSSSLKAKPLLLAQAVQVSQSDGSQVHRGICDPERSATARIAIAGTALRPHGPQNGYVRPLPDMHLLSPYRTSWRNMPTDPTIFKGLVKPRRVREFGQRPGLCFRHLKMAYAARCCQRPRDHTPSLCEGAYEFCSSGFSGTRTVLVLAIFRKRDCPLVLSSFQQEYRGKELVVCL